MKLLSRVCIFVLSVSWIRSPPVNKPQEETEDDGGVSELMYQRYLQEVVAILEKDEGFRQKLEGANTTHIRSFDFARELNFVDHQVREQLDEAKRNEIKRLTDLHKQVEDIEKLKEQKGHLDEKYNTFEVEDLHKLIKKTTDDLEEIDKRRRDQFHTYEMQKEHERKEKLKDMDEAHRKEAEKAHEEELAKHNEHPKVNHPGSKTQLEDVWEKEDHLDRDAFDPKTFFNQRDLNGDGILSYDEIDSFFQLELDKLYEANHTEDDMRERYEEMARMREHLVNEIDTNNDSLVTKEEFLTYSQTKQFENNEDWEDIGDKPQYTEEELAEYEKMLAEQQDKMKAGGYDQHAQPGEVNIPVAPNVQEMEHPAGA